MRKARLDSARSVLDLARQHAADFIVLAGDTFESNGVSRDLIGEVADILGGAKCPVYAIPGNHDPLQTGSVWDHHSWTH